MANPTADTAIKQALTNEIKGPVKASTTIYKGSMLSNEVTAGYFTMLVAEDKFRGLALEYVDNSAGADGAKDVKILNGKFRLLTSLAATDAQAEGKTAVYTTSANLADLTFTQGTNTQVGYCVGRNAAGKAIVEFDTHVA